MLTHIINFAGVKWKPANRWVGPFSGVVVIKGFLVACSVCLLFNIVCDVSLVIRLNDLWHRKERLRETTKYGYLTTMIWEKIIMIYKDSILPNNAWAVKLLLFHQYLCVTINDLHTKKENISSQQKRNFISIETTTPLENLQTYRVARPF